MVGEWLRNRAENLIAFMLLGMFVIFLMQIAFRYVLNVSIGWTHEANGAPERQCRSLPILWMRTCRGLGKRGCDRANRC